MEAANWQPLGDHQVRVIPVYETMRWDPEDVEFGDCVVAAAPFGGPVAVTRDTSKLTAMRGGDDDISIYSASGKLVRGGAGFWRRGASRRHSAPRRAARERARLPR